MKNLILSIIVLFVIGFAGWTLFSNRDTNDLNNSYNQEGEVVAIVNGEAISKTDFELTRQQLATQQGFDFESLDADAQAQIDNEVLNSVIVQALLSQAASDANLNISDADVQAQIEIIKLQFESDEEFQEALAFQNFSEEDFEETIRKNLELEAYLEREINFSSISATEEEVIQAYADITAGQEAPELDEVYAQVEQLVIQQKNQELINKLLSELRGDANIEIFI